MLSIQITPDSPEIGARLDKMLTARLETLSRTRVQGLIKDGAVLIDGKPGKASYRLEGGETIDVQYEIQADSSSEESLLVRAEPIPLDVIYEDATIVAINKPAGMVVHPAVGHMSGTLVNGLIYRWPQIEQVGEQGRSGIVHRLDKDTSGVILVAKTEAARRYLAAQFKARKVKKHYIALVDGVPDTPTGEINAPMGRHPAQRKRMAVLSGGRSAVTIYRVLQVYAEGRYSLVELAPQTGRTHQIRVHMVFIGHPIVGDVVYGRRKPRHKSDFKLERQFLHAESLEFSSPLDKRSLKISAPLPESLQGILEKLATL